MAQTRTAIAADINGHIQKQGGAYRAWYVGISQDPQKRLFADHNVSKDRDWWLYREALSETDARAVEQHFLSLGCRGSTGGGDADCRYVYAYLIQNHTRE